MYRSFPSLSEQVSSERILYSTKERFAMRKSFAVRKKVLPREREFCREKESFALGKNVLL